MRRLHNVVVDQFTGNGHLSTLCGPPAKRSLPACSGPTHLFAAPTPAFGMTRDHSGLGAASTPAIISVCREAGDRPSVSESPSGVNADKQRLHADSPMSLHPKNHFGCSMGWFTLIDAQLRLSELAGFATTSRVPQYGVGYADSQGGLQSFHS